MGTVGSDRATRGLLAPSFTMIDREKVLAVLRRRFHGASHTETAAAANAIVGLDDEWREVECTDLRELVERLREGCEFMLLERCKTATDTPRRQPLLSASLRLAISVELPNLRLCNC